MLETYCNTIRNRWREGRCFVSKQYFVFKSPYESNTWYFIKAHRYTKPFSDGVWDIDTKVIKEELLKILYEGEGEDLLYQDIKVLKRKKKCLEYFSKYTPRHMCNIFYSLFKYDNLE